MRAYLIIFLSPLLNQYFGFFKCGKDFPVKQLISELAVKRLNITILPGAALFNVQGLDSYSIELAPDSFRRKLRATIKS